MKLKNDLREQLEIISYMFQADAETYEIYKRLNDIIDLKSNKILYLCPSVESSKKYYINAKKVRNNIPFKFYDTLRKLELDKTEFYVRSITELNVLEGLKFKRIEFMIDK